MRYSAAELSVQRRPRLRSASRGAPVRMHDKELELGTRADRQGTPSASAMNRLRPRSVTCVLGDLCSSRHRVLLSSSTAATNGGGTVSGAGLEAAGSPPAARGSYRKATSCSEQLSI